MHSSPSFDPAGHLGWVFVAPAVRIHSPRYWISSSSPSFPSFSLSAQWFLSSDKPLSVIVISWGSEESLEQHEAQKAKVLLKLGVCYA
jgi:hypothetical protein